MQMKIMYADVSAPRVQAFLQAHLDDIAPTAPDESQHALSLAELADPSVRLWAVRDGDEVVGTGALAALEPGHEELKSMRTDPVRRGQGIARKLLEYLDDAKSRGITRISLETGSMDFFAPARALYAGAGFAPCAPFGSYVEDPNSTFMTRVL